MVGSFINNYRYSGSFHTLTLAYTNRRCEVSLRRFVNLPTFLENADRRYLETSSKIWLIGKSKAVQKQS